MKLEARRSDIQGTGLFAGQQIVADQSILFLTGRRMDTDEAQLWCDEGRVRYDDPFQVEDHEYLILDEVPNYINHSCNPNCGIRGENELVALRDIKEGEELSYDYSSVVGADDPWETSWWMACNCGAATCRKRVGNWESLSGEQLAYYGSKGALPDFVRAQIIRTTAGKKN